MLLSILRKAKPGGRFLQEACWVALLSDAIGRGGEIRLQNFTHWEWHEHLQLTNAPWTELKTLSRYAMGMVPHSQWVFDFYHRFACYFAFEDGLHREDKDIKKGLQNKVFPALNLMTLGSVASLVTNIIRDNFPTECPQDMIMSYSSKSCRHGAITECANSGQLTIFDVCGRSGHSTGTTVDTYYDRSNPITGLRAAKARNGYVNINAKIVLPHLEAIGIGEPTIKRLMDKVFEISVPLFFEDGLLYPILRICLASLIMHHSQVCNDLGCTSFIASSLKNRFRQASISDARFPNQSPEQVLVKWSAFIREDMDRRSQDHLEVSPDLASLVLGVNSTMKMILEMKSDVSSLVRKQNNLEVQVASLESENGQLRQNDKHLQQEAQYLREKYRTAKLQWKKSLLVHSPSPQHHRFPHENEMDLPPEEVYADHSTTGPSMLRSSIGSTCTSSEIITTAKRQLADWSDAAERKSSSKRNKQDDIRCLKALLVDLSTMSALNALDLSKSTIQSRYVTEKSALTFSLELVQYIVSKPGQNADMKRQRNILLSKESSNSDRLKAASTLVNACMNQLDIFEERPINSRGGKSRRTTDTYIAIGGRVKAHKKVLMSLGGDKITKFSNQPLMLKSEINTDPPGTPPDTKSLRGFFLSKFMKDV